MIKYITEIPYKIVTEKEIESEENIKDLELS